MRLDSPLSSLATLGSRLAVDHDSRGWQSHCPQSLLFSWGRPSPPALGSFPLPGQDAFVTCSCWPLPAVPVVGTAPLAPTSTKVRGDARLHRMDRTTEGSRRCHSQHLCQHLGPPKRTRFPSYLRTGSSSSVSFPRGGDEVPCLSELHEPSLHTRHVAAPCWDQSWQHCGGGALIGEETEAQR